MRILPRNNCHRPTSDSHCSSMAPFLAFDGFRMAFICLFTSIVMISGVMVARHVHCTAALDEPAGWVLQAHGHWHATWSSLYTSSNTYPAELRLRLHGLNLLNSSSSCSEFLDGEENWSRLPHLTDRARALRWHSRLRLQGCCGSTPSVLSHPLPTSVLGQPCAVLSATLPTPNHPKDRRRSRSSKVPPSEASAICLRPYQGRQVLL